MKTPRTQEDRLIRLLIISWFILFLIGLFASLWVSVRFKDLQSQVQLAIHQKPLIIRGIDGAAGPQGIQGMSGLSIVGPRGPAGRDGQSVTAQQIAAAVAAYLQANPPQGTTGPEGPRGNDGRTLQVRVDPKSCQLESKYEDEDNWTVLAQLSKPCDSNTAQP